MDLVWLLNSAIALLEANRLPLTFAAIALSVVFLLRRNGFIGRLWHALEEVVFNNWLLALLGATGFVLALASGWTTWDGMWNFTCPEAADGTTKLQNCMSGGVLALMVTFGIQGIMLTIAWLIGESFATGMNQLPKGNARPAAGQRASFVSEEVKVFAGAGVGILLFVSLFILGMQRFLSIDVTQTSTFDSHNLSTLGDRLLFAAVGLLFIATIALNAGHELIEPYLKTVRVIIKNAALWVMFLACMATSVFFSFDSLFSTIFPQRERERAAELRALNQVAGIVSDVGATAKRAQIELATGLFDSDGWKAYDGQLSALAKAATDSKGEIAAYFVQQMEARRASIAQQNERIATAQSGQAGLANKKTSLTDELSRLSAERPGLAAEYQQLKAELDQKAKDIDAKKVEMLAEEKGVEGSLKVGRGQIYRQRSAELDRLQDEYKIKEERTRFAQKRLNDAETRIAQIQRELSGIDAELAKLKGEASTAEQRIKLAEEDSKSGTEAPKVDPDHVLPAFERARAEFREDPTVEKLNGIERYCSDLVRALKGAPATAAKVSAIDCDPKGAAEAAAKVFALNAGLVAFEANCAGGSKMPQSGGADALFAFARKCAQDVQLPSKETDALRTRIASVELARDDKAHRFVVTWNAFQDGNRLAYLALAIAIAMDGLVFMSGLYGANALRSPLQDVPTTKARSAKQLDAIINAALLPDPFKTAHLVLSAMHPLRDGSEFTNQIDLAELDPETQGHVRAVLNAAATMGAVEPGARKGHYLIRPELHEFLSDTVRRELKRNPVATREIMDLTKLEKELAVALLPEVEANADTVLHHIHPIDAKNGFMGEIKLGEIADAHSGDLKVVRRALNVGASFNLVQKKSSSSDYFIHNDFYRTLARFRARLMLSGAGLPQLGSRPEPRAALEGGNLSSPLRQRLASSADRMDEGHTRLPPPAPKSPGRRPPPLPAADRADEFRDALLATIGLYLDSLKLISRSDLVDEAARAGEALKNLMRRKTELSESLATTERQFKERLDPCWTQLNDDCTSDDEIATLKDVYREVIDALPTLMLVRSGPVEEIVADMIGALEKSAGRDNGLRNGDNELLQRLKRLAGDLAAEDRKSPQSWAQIEDLLNDYEERPFGLPNVIETPRGAA